MVVQYVHFSICCFSIWRFFICGLGIRRFIRLLRFPVSNTLRTFTTVLCNAALLDDRHPFHGLVSRTTWLQLDRMQIICTSLKRGNHANTTLQAGHSSWHPTNSVKAPKTYFYAGCNMTNHGGRPMINVKSSVVSLASVSTISPDLASSLKGE